MIVHSDVKCSGLKLSIHNSGGICIGSAYLYTMHNRHDRRFGLMEDVYVLPSARGCGVGSTLIKEIIRIAAQRKCYKLIATSRYSREKVHELYLSLGFKKQGEEFRMDF